MRDCRSSSFPLVTKAKLDISSARSKMNSPKYSVILPCSAEAIASFSTKALLYLIFFFNLI